MDHRTKKTERTRVHNVIERTKYKELMKDFNEYLEYQKNCGLSNRYGILSQVHRLLEHSEKDPEGIEKEDVIDFLKYKDDCKPKTLNMYKTSFNRFFEWLDRGNVMEDIEKASVKRFKNHEKKPIKEEEYKKIMESFKDLERNKLHRYRNITLVAFLWHTGARIGEILDLTREDITPEDHGLKVRIDTEKRDDIRYNWILKDRCNYYNIIIRYLNMRDFEDNKYLFPPLSGRAKRDIMDRGSVGRLLRYTKKKVGIERRIHPHLFRHTCATRMSKEGFNENFMRRWFGWARGSEMPEVYNHLNSKEDMDQELMAMYGVDKGSKDSSNRKERVIQVNGGSEVKPSKVVVECPNCGEEMKVSL